jgi:hypothetical protein
LFDSSINGTLDVGRFNFGKITIIPICDDASVIIKFMPIYLVNDILKMVTTCMFKKIGSLNLLVSSLIKLKLYLPK